MCRGGREQRAKTVTYRVPSCARSEAGRTTTGVRARSDVVEARRARRVDERVQEAERRLALRKAEVVQQGDDTSEGLPSANGAEEDRVRMDDDSVSWCNARSCACDHLRESWRWYRRQTPHVRR